MGPYARNGFLVRVTYLTLALLTYILSGAGRFGRGSVVVLCYHGISQGYRNAFAWQMSHIAHRTTSPEELRRAPSRRFGAMPRVCVTFDDGFENLLENAVPVLEQLGVPAMVFIVPANMGTKPRWNMPPGHSEAKERLMDQVQIEGLVKHRGIQVGSHTLTHANLTALEMPDLRRELLESKILLENTLRAPVTAVAFPYGACNKAILDAAEFVGYMLACTLEPRLYSSKKDGLRVGRFSMSPGVWPIEFYLTCAGAYSWLLSWRRLVACGRAFLSALQGSKKAGS